jgi:hypothetical protein
VAGGGTVGRRVIAAGLDWPGLRDDDKSSMTVSGVFPLIAGAVYMGCTPSERIARRPFPD